MNKLRTGLLLSGLIILLSGCTSSPYLRDRGNDALDIFTGSIGVGAGAKARVSCINAGLIYNIDAWGLCGGEIIEPHFTYPCSFAAEATSLGIQEYGIHTTPGLTAKRGKTFCAKTICAMGFLQSPAYSYGAEFTFSPKYEKFPIYYYTQIEASADIVGGIHIGFNPGELVDFILGWSMLDIFEDDYYTEEENDSSADLIKEYERQQKTDNKVRDH